MGSTSKFRHVALVAVFVWAAAGCGETRGGPATFPPTARPADGLLQDAELQSVVDDQVARAWQPLVGYLTHERGAVRARAALALASVQAYQAVPALVETLDDPEAGVRRDAAFALGQSAQQSAAEPLLSALAGESVPEVRHRMLEALGKLGFEEVLRGLLGLEVTGADQADRLLALARLGAMQGRVTQASKNELAAHLDDEDAAARRAAAYFFGRMRDPSSWAPRVARVRQALDGYAPDDPAAMHLVKALGLLKDPADMERLTGFAQAAPDWRVRAEAMTALAGRELDAPAREALMQGLDDPSIHVAVNAATALAGSTHLPSVLGRIVRWIEDHPDRWQVAGPLLDNLARQDQQEFVLSWVDGLEEEDEQRWEIGLRALGRMRGEEAFGRLEAAMDDESRRIATAAMAGLRQRWAADEADPRLHDRYFGLFARAVGSGRPDVVRVAAAALALPAFSSRGNTEVLVAAMEAAPLPEGLEVVTTLVNTLGQTGDPQVREVLREALGHPYAEVRRVAAAALAQHFGEEMDVPEGGLPSPPDPALEPGLDPARIDWDELSRLGPYPRLVLETTRGTLVVRMSSEEAPHTVQTIARLAKAGRFDGTPFHRVVPNFVAQGGDVGEGNGRGGPGFAITTEITQISYERGVIGMASAGKDTEGSQFFLVHSAQPHLDGGYTAFGWIVEGWQALDAIARGDLLISARVEQEPANGS